MKKSALLFCFLLLVAVGYAQKKQNIYYLNDDFKPVSTRDSADVIRIVEEPDSGATLFIIKEFYKNGKIKTLGKASSFEPNPIYVGQVALYDTLGKKEALINFFNNNYSGLSYYFYNNGTLNKTLDYILGRPDTSLNLGNGAVEKRYKLMYFADSLGNILVKDGNGHCSFTTIEGGEVYTEEGDYVDGEKNGLHTLKNQDNSYWYQEEFNKGRFISGKSFKYGTEHSYTAMTETPNFPKGIKYFYQYLSNEIRYPSDASRAQVQGKVFMSYVTEKDGSVSNVKVDRGLYPSIDQEAIRVLLRSPKWIPGTQHGIPVRTKYNIPLSFSLNKRS